MDANGANPTNLKQSDPDDRDPAWSPRGWRQRKVRHE